MIDQNRVQFTSDFHKNEFLKRQNIVPYISSIKTPVVNTGTPFYNIKKSAFN